MIGEKLRELRVHRKLTQKELGDLLGKSASAVGMYEQGRRIPEIDIIGKYCQIFDTTFNDLLLEVPPPQRMEIHVFVDEIKRQLYGLSGLLFDRTEDGEERILNSEELEKVYAAILVGVEVTRRLNQMKYTPKKHLPDEPPV